MNIVRKDIDLNNSIVKLTIEKADYTEKVEKTLRDYRKKANIPGFRPGNVPIGLVKKMYGKSVLAEEINKIVSDELYKYIRESDIKLLGEPMPNETEQVEIDFDTQEDFEFSFDLGIAPEFEVELTKKDKINYYSINVSDEMIDNQIKSYTSRYGKYVQEDLVEEKDMLKGDMVELSEGVVKEGGLVVKDATLTISYMKDDNQKALFAGAKKGDIVCFNPALAYVEESEISSLLKISKEEASTVNSDFQLTISSITRYYEAEIDQDLFDKVYEKDTVKSVEEFRNKITENIKGNLVDDSEYKFGLDTREALIAKYGELTFPDAFLKRWVLATNENLTEEALEKDFSKMLEDLKWQLIKDKIAKTNNIQVEASDIEDYAKKITRAQLAQYGMVGMDDELIANYSKDMLKKEETVKNIVERVIENKVYAIVKDSAKINNKEISMEEFNKFF